MIAKAYLGIPVRLVSYCLHDLHQLKFQLRHSRRDHHCRSFLPAECVLDIATIQSISGIWGDIVTLPSCQYYSHPSMRQKITIG
jgi:nitric oxide reductase large subunit